MEDVGPLEIILWVMGGICAIFTFYKGYVTGYYPSETPILLASAVGTIISFFAANRIATRRKNARLAAEDRKRGLV
ncbi:MAG: hypothetical protein LKG20_02395 [Tetrasphaera jenkinsii]|jgi:hypothetical protein|nr:hypothetical protein [Tetrasphaera jenkinsii]